MAMDIEICDAHEEDVEGICDLLTLLFSQEADFEPDYARQREGVAMVIRNRENGRFLILKEADNIIGTVSLLFTISTALGGKVALLEDMIIHPDNRGTGLGRLLLEKAIETAKSHGCLRITLLTDTDNHTAQSLYKKYGFEPSHMIPMRLVFSDLDKSSPVSCPATKLA
jgi:GNAT superfamily N-acetyltransferase